MIDGYVNKMLSKQIFGDKLSHVEGFELVFDLRNNKKNVQLQINARNRTLKLQRLVFHNDM